MYEWAKALYPIRRSLTGEGNRATLRFLKRQVEELEIHEVAAGTKAFDWEVPPEWKVGEAWVKGPDGEKVLDVAEHTLHLLGYSEGVDRTMSLEELGPHLFSRPDMPTAIPYMTSYYERRWGFCLSEEQRTRLKPGLYHARIDARFDASGSMTYGEVVVAGETKEEVLLSTYICHPSMGNNELSGPVVLTALLRWLKQKKRRYTYRALFLPETIGAIYYLSRHLEHLQERVRAGFVLTCLGDERGYSFLPSRKGDTLTDRVARHMFRHLGVEVKEYDYQRHRGSDERQYCSAGVDLPVVVMMRSKFHEYPEYHTSLDDLSLITPAGLEGGFEMHRRAIEILEMNRTYRTTVLCEPRLGRRGLYPTLGASRQGGKPEWVKRIRNILVNADGEEDLVAIAERAGFDLLEAREAIKRLVEEGLLEEVRT